MTQKEKHSRKSRAKTQLEETNVRLNEQMMIFGKFGKQISSLLLPGSIRALEQYAELSNKIMEQLSPLKDVIEEINRAQQTAKTALEPMLQHFAPLFKQLEEQIKTLDGLYVFHSHKIDNYYSSETTVLPSLRTQQNTKIVPELRKITRLIEKAIIKKDEPVQAGWFNYKSGSIGFHGDSYKPRNEYQVKFVRQLIMHYQKQNKNGKILKEGQRIPERILAIETDLPIEKFREIKKQLTRSLKEKEFPLKIDLNAEGILLIYTI